MVIGFTYLERGGPNTIYMQIHVKDGARFPHTNTNITVFFECRDVKNKILYETGLASNFIVGQFFKYLVFLKNGHNVFCGGGHFNFSSSPITSF